MITENTGKRCTRCGQTFESEEELRDHQKKVHTAGDRHAGSGEAGEQETAA
jgi:hypothetical protein